MSKTLITADPHFGHRNIIRYCNRPFKNTDEMDAGLIQRWNSRVNDGDDIWVVGDFAFTVDTKYVEHTILPQLKGNIHMVWGNHDQVARKLAHRFASTHDLVEIVVQGQSIVLCHYAMRTWHHVQRGVWHLFGHTHATLGPYGKSFDVGVDAHDYYPWTFEEIKAKMDTLTQFVPEKNFKCNACLKLPCICDEMEKGNQE